MTSESELWNFQDVKKSWLKLLKVDSKIVCLKGQWRLCIQFYSLNWVKYAISKSKVCDENILTYSKEKAEIFRQMFVDLRNSTVEIGDGRVILI